VRWLALIVLLSLLLSGCTGPEEERRSPLGLKADTEECDNDRELDRDAELMNCYHSAALTHAYLGTQEADNICLKIWDRFGEGNINPDSDVVVKAEMVSNACFYDIALIMADEHLCSNIMPRRTDRNNNVDTKLLGEAVSEERCVVEARRRAKIAPEHYWSTENNLCSMIFILPMLLLGAFIKYP
jgi:hypothetical protein